MNDKTGGIFGFIPDFDGDGDQDIMDFLIMQDCLREEELAENESPELDCYSDLLSDDALYLPEDEI